MATKKFLAGFLALMVTMELVMTTALAAEAEAESRFILKKLLLAKALGLKKKLLLAKVIKAVLAALAIGGIGAAALAARSRTTAAAATTTTTAATTTTASTTMAV